MKQTTRVAVLGTLAEFYMSSAIPYDMQALVDLVVDVHPDLLCLDISPAQWQRGDFAGWRGGLIGWLHDRLAALQQSAPGLDAINRGWRHDLGNLIYHLIALLATGDVEQQRKRHLVTLRAQVVQTARRDPGARILVVVNIQYCHLLRPELGRQPDIEMVTYHEL
jgi:hypothetical protein